MAERVVSFPLSPVVGQEWMAPHRWRWNAPKIDKDTGEKHFTISATSLWNIRTTIEFHPDLKGMFVYDEFKDEVIMTRGLPGDGRSGYPRQLTDNDETALTAWLNINGLTPSIAIAAAAIREVAFRAPINPLKNLFSELIWDGKPRVDTWLTRYAGVEDTEYARMVGRKFLISAIARLMTPGCKCDTMPVFEGAQGIKKSTMMRVLAGAEHFSDQIGDISNKDAQGMIQGKWIIEVPELDKFNKKETDTIKDFLARQEDRYRPPYGRNVITRPRRCVFVGTINPLVGSGYIRDPTGARRFWPVVCGEIDLKALERDREQLWAEAHEMWAMGQTWWIDADEIHVVLETQEDRIDQDIWLPRVAEWLRDAPFEFTVSEVLKDAVYVDINRQDQRMKVRMSGILTTLKCETGRSRVDGKQQRVYRRTM